MYRYMYYSLNVGALCTGQQNEQVKFQLNKSSTGMHSYHTGRFCSTLPSGDMFAHYKLKIKHALPTTWYMNVYDITHKKCFKCLQIDAQLISRFFEAKYSFTSNYNWISAIFDIHVLYVCNLFCALCV